MVSKPVAPFPMLSRFFVVAILFLVDPIIWSHTPSLFAEAYRVGEVVDSSISTRSTLVIDMLIANQPLFGVPKTVHLPRLPERFSLSFDEGFHRLPYFDAESTEKLIVTFVYSKSGAGRIHSVTSQAIRSSTKKFDHTKEIEVFYDWIEEADVDIEAGSIVMFLVAFVVSILFLLQLCSIEDHDDNYDNNYDVGSNKGR